MKRLDLASLFACLVAGCGPEVSDVETSGPTAPSTSGNPCSYDYEEEVDVLWFDYANALGDDDILSQQECQELCGDYGVGGAVRCTTPEAEGESSGSGSSGGVDGGAQGETGDEDADAGGTAGEPMEQADVTVTCIREMVCGLGGRLHAALRSDGAVRDGDAVGRWLASMAHAEEASVTSFHAIAAELEAHGAPQELVERARAAADDEVRHAHAMRALARARGVEPASPQFGRIEVRDLRSIAIENAAEGCVRELWAALEATHQAEMAPDPDLRSAMRTIAQDETRHAELALDLDAWLRTVLDNEAWAEVESARRRAAGELAAAVGSDGSTQLRRALGLPSSMAAAQLHTELSQRLWS